jgi:hypothetical protein
MASATPATPSQAKDGVGNGGKGRSVTAHRKRSTRARIFRELVHIAAEQGHEIPLGISTADALQQCLDRAVSLLRFAQDQVDEIIPESWQLPEGYDSISQLPVEQDPLFEVTPNPNGAPTVRRHRYLEMEAEARTEVEKLAAMMTQLGIAERVVRVQEAQAALMISAVRDAAMMIGLDNDQIRELGAALRHRVAEGHRDATGGGLQKKVEIPREEMREASHTFIEAKAIEKEING